MTEETLTGHPENARVPAVARISTPLEEVDGALLDEAQRLLGISSRVEVIDRALGELIRDRQRRLAAQAQLYRFEHGQFEVLRSARGRS